MALISHIDRERMRPHISDGVLKSADYENLLEANRILEEAQAEAVAGAERAEKAYEAAKKRGYRDGKRQAAREAAGHHIGFVERSILYLRDLEEDLARIILEALRKITGEMDSDMLTERIVLKSLRRYRALPQLTLKVAPQQEESMRAQLEDLSRKASLGAALRLEADSRLTSRDCLLESPLGVVDIGLDTQLYFLEKSLKEKHAISFALNAKGKGDLTEKDAKKEKEKKEPKKLAPKKEKKKRAAP